MRLAAVCLYISLMLHGAPAFSEVSEASATQTLSAAFRKYIIKAPVMEKSIDDSVRASGGVVIESEGLWLRADEITGSLLTSDWEARGAVTLQQDGQKLVADSARFNVENRLGMLSAARGQYGEYYFRGDQIELLSDESVEISGAKGTTCNLDHPHWALGAASIEIDPDRRYARAKRIGVFLNGRRVVSIPDYRFNLQESSRNLLPTPGYDRRDGAYVRYSYPMAAPLRSSALLSGRLTQKNGLLALLEIQREIKVNRLSNIPVGVLRVDGDVLPDLTNIELLRDPYPPLRLRPPGESAPPLTAGRRESRSFHAFLKLGQRERIYDNDVRNLYLDRLPEAGLRLTAIPFGHLGTQNNPVYLDVQTSLGRFREPGYTDWINRIDTRAKLGLHTSIGGRWLLEPAMLARYSTYSGGFNQQIYSGSIAIGRKITPQYFLAFTYVNHLSSGASPLEFDDLDVKEKLATRLQADLRQTRGNFELDFDLKSGGVYDWIFEISHVFHCVEPKVRYQHRFSHWSFGIDFVPVSF